MIEIHKVGPRSSKSSNPKIANYNIYIRSPPWAYGRRGAASHVYHLVNRSSSDTFSKNVSKYRCYMNVHMTFPIMVPKNNQNAKLNPVLCFFTCCEQISIPSAGILVQKRTTWLEDVSLHVKSSQNPHRLKIATIPSFFWTITEASD